MGKRNIVWNDYISQNERFADFFNGVIFQGKQFVLPENLTELNTKLWRKQRSRVSYHEFIRDTVKLWEYQGAKYILESREIRDYVAPFWNDFSINRFDIHELKSSDIFRTDLREVLGFLMRQRDKEKLRQYVEENEAFRRMKEDAFDVLCMYSEGRELAIRKEEYRTKGGMNMCTALRELKEEGRAEGRAEARAEKKERIEKERAALNKLTCFLINEGRIEDLSRASTDSEYQNQLLIEYGFLTKFSKPV